MTDKKKPDEAPEAQAPEAPAPEARSGAGGGKPWPESPEDPESGSAALPEASEPVDAEFSDETPAAPESEIPDPAAPDPAAPGIVEEAGDGDGYPRRDSVGDDVDDAGSSELAAGLDSGSDLPASETAEPDDALAPHAAGHDYDDHPAEDEPEHDDQARPSLAARALQALVILLVGAAIALWALPRVAPMLPAPVAEALAPVHEVSEADLTALRADLEARIAALETAAPAAPDLGPVTARLEDFGARLDALEGAGGGDAPAGGSDLGEANQAAISSLRAELEQMSATLAELGSLPPEAAASLATASQRAASLSEKVDALASRLDAAEARFDERATAAETAAAAAKEEAAAAEKRATLAAGFRAIGQALDEGQAFAEPLRAIAAYGEAPKALAAAAPGGVPTLASLRDRFTDAGRRAMEAQGLAEAGDGFLDRAAASLRARVAGVPVEAMEGDGLEARLGRAAAALRDGDLPAALTALEGIPHPAEEAMADWLADARARAAAVAAAAAWRTELGG